MNLRVPAQVFTFQETDLPSKSSPSWYSLSPWLIKAVAQWLGPEDSSRRPRMAGAAPLSMPRATWHEATCSPRRAAAASVAKTTSAPRLTCSETRRG